ncbi:acyltransferase family protein [Dickeya zeae]|uniref:Acyltransferase n=1 Tax=Dickeya zeae TaxID=204042 RepID=A0ABX8W7B0_9GAMM|nr:acyltransferase [Dickeya zeae]QYM94041.1 acyltransferase [Dickeya zeae]
MLNSIHQALWFVAIIVVSGFLFCFLPSKQNIKNNRINNVDGLRYVLASIVSVSHFIYTYNYIKTSDWSEGEYYMLGRIGAIAVSVFFLLSGYLFASKISSEDERWYPFYFKRIFRIVPMTYVSSIICVIFAYHYASDLKSIDFRLVLYWFDGGFFNERPQLFGGPTKVFNADVTWTLVYEWALYAALPLVWIINKSTGMKATRAIPIMVLFISFYGVSAWSYRLGVYISFFAVGAIIKDIASLNLIRKGAFLDVASLVFFVFSFVSAYYSDPLAYQCLVFYSLFFFTIISGSTWFGLLTTKGFVLLGNASYSMYLLHNFFWFIAIKLFGRYDLKIGYVFYSLTFVLICAVSVMTYKFIETPMNKFAERFSNKYLN